MSNEDFYAEFGNELLVAQRARLLGQQPLPRRPLHGDRQARQPGLPDVRRPGRRLPGAGLPAVVPDLRQLLGHRQPRGHVARSLPASRCRSIANADAVEGNARSPYHDDFALDRIEQALRDENEARAAQPRLPRQERAENMLYAAQVNSKALQRVTPYIPTTIPKERLSQQAEIALASFKAGVCVSANLTIGQFDSHANNDVDQMKLIPEFLAGIAYLIRRAEELKIRDKLVVVVQSEMGRTPTYNNGNGKDHWSIGSVMFLGRGIQGNRVIGATDEKQFHVPLNPQTLACDKDKGIRVRPEHIHERSAQFAGIADHPFSKKFPLGVLDKEKLQGFWG